jgi:hypothetical protein
VYPSSNPAFAAVRLRIMIATIEIVRILHDRMDLLRQLPKNDSNE